MITLYGIPNCDKIRAARRWLEGRDIGYLFHDFRRDGLEEARLRAWCGKLGWENLLNRRGAAWRALPPAERAGLDEGRAQALMRAQPVVIRRPVLEAGELLLVGFEPALYEEHLAGQRIR